MRKHLEADIRSGDVKLIRRELFKERLGHHWDMLTEGVVSFLVSVDPISPEEVLRSLEAYEPALVETESLRIERKGQTRVSVRVMARDATEWGLLGQHIPGDPLWAAAKEFEEAVEKQLDAQQELELGVIKELQLALDVSVVEAVDETPGLARHLARWVSSEAVRTAGGISFRPLLEEEVHESSAGQMKVRDVPRAARLPGRKVDLVSALNEVIIRMAQSDEVNRVLSATQQVRRCHEALTRVVDHTRLLTYLPGVCEVCVRIAV